MPKVVFNGHLGSVALDRLTITFYAATPLWISKIEKGIVRH